MTQINRDIQRKLRILRHAEETGHVARTCRYFGVGRASFYRWKGALQKHGETSLARKKPIPKNPKNRTPPEIIEKIIHLRKTYHLGPVRIVWYLARCQRPPPDLTTGISASALRPRNPSLEKGPKSSSRPPA